MNKEKALVQKGKRLSYLLRHDQSYTFDAHGYREVSDLIQNHGYTMEELLEIVATNNKKRYEFNEDKTKIRARQGHSVNVNVDLRECVPPDILYHGTATRFLESILKTGINKGTAARSPVARRGDGSQGGGETWLSRCAAYQCEADA